MTTPTPAQDHSAQITNEEQAYDSVPYESHCYRKTHPEHLRVVAELFGLSPADHKTARILEIGCAAGGNILPIAAKHPKAEIVGIDISGQQIKSAQEQAKTLDFKNITFIQGDISSLDEELGHFDYIICHGVYSWVPSHVRNAIMTQCKALLAPTGLAVISYNTLPGWSTVKGLRDMMLFHTQSFDTPQQKIFESRALLNFLYNNTPESNTSYREAIDQERKILEKTDDSYLFHDHLETENHQFYFHEFAKHAQENDLAYVGDTEMHSMYLGNYSQDVQKTLGTIKNIVRQEQYIDFITNRRFRQSIITPAENAKNLSRNLSKECVLKYHIQGLFRPESTTPDTNGNIKFMRPNGSHFEIKDPTIQALLLTLAAHNAPILASTLIEATHKSLPSTPKEDIEKALVNIGIELLFKNIIEIKPDTFTYTHTISKKPRASALARLQATYHTQRKSKRHMITNLNHESALLDTGATLLLPLIDGKTDKKGLLKGVEALLRSGDLTLNRGKDRVEDIDEALKLAPEYLDNMLQKFARLNLLEK